MRRSVAWLLLAAAVAYLLGYLLNLALTPLGVGIPRSVLLVGLGYALTLALLSRSARIDVPTLLLVVGAAGTITLSALVNEVSIGPYVSALVYFVAPLLLLTVRPAALGSALAVTGRSVLVPLVPLLALISIGLYQALTNTPLFAPTGGNVAIWNFYGRTRAFSVFESSAYFGLYLTYTLSAIVPGLDRRVTVRNGIIVMATAAALVTLYFTYTRLAYITVALTVLNFLALRFLAKRGGVGVVVLGAAVNLLVGVAFVAVSSRLAVTQGTLSSESILIRLRNWEQLLGYVADGGWVSYVAGEFLVKNDVVVRNTPVIVDNLFISGVVSFGVVYVVLVVAAYLRAVSGLYADARATRSAGLLGVVGFLLTWPFSNIFGNLADQYSAYVALTVAVLIIGSTREHRYSGLRDGVFGRQPRRQFGDEASVR